jgi:DNA-binding CsgD family transcriptional regulator
MLPRLRATAGVLSPTGGRRPVDAHSGRGAVVLAADARRVQLPPGQLGPGDTRAYEQAFHSAPVPALLFDGYRVTSANEAAQRLMDNSEISISFLRELRAFVSRGHFAGEPLTIDGATMRFRVLLPTASDSNENLRICYLVPTRCETPADLYARRGLTRPEIRVATFLLRGMTNRAIAANLGRSVETIHKHVSKVLRKCDVSNRSAFVALALGGLPLPIAGSLPGS